MVPLVDSGEDIELITLMFYTCCFFAVIVEVLCYRFIGLRCS